MAVRRAFWRILKAAKLPQFRLYDLRHTYASMRLLDGAPITYVSAQLGHRDAAITLRFYAKWAEVQDRRWVEDDRPVVGFPNVRPSRTRRPTT
jgi:integrase